MRTQRWLILAALAGTPPAAAAPDNQTPPGLFDPPQAVQRIEGPELTAAQSFECTWYPDFMLRETETDSPGRGQSYLVPHSPGTPRPPCPGMHHATDIPLDRGSVSFEGRKGAFLFYGTTDAPNTEPFSIWHEPDGKRIYTDVMNSQPGLKAMSVTAGVLHLTYIRAYQADCSLPKDSVRCWTKSMQAGHFPRAIASLPPPIAACAATYRAAQAPVTNGSTITYTVEISLAAEGKSAILSRGTPACDTPD